MEQPLDLYLDLIEPPDARCWSPFKRRSSTLLRNYLGTWELLDQHLYLVSIQAKFLDDTVVTLDSLFPGYPERVFAHWYSGHLTCYGGAVIGSRNEYESIHEEEHVFTICRGKVTDTVTINTADLVRKAKPTVSYTHRIGRLLGRRN